MNGGPVAILFDRLGPYHLARLEAAAQLFPVVAVETSGITREYAWDRIEGARNFERVTLFENRDSREVDAALVRKRIRSALSESDAEAVLIPGWGTPAALGALEWCRRHRRAAIVMSESNAFDEARPVIREMVKGRIVRLFDAALVGGQSHVDYLRGLGFPQDRVFSGYDVVDNEYFARNTVAVRQNSAALRHDLNLPERFFLAAARFVPRKNLDRLLTAYAAYRKTAGPDAWKLVLLGDGPLRAELEAARGSLRLTNEVLMPGFIQYPELPKYYGLAGAFIHASSTEQWGLVVNEAMASGLPVIVSKSCGCARELVREGENGFTFDPRDTRRLADLILNLAASAEERREAMGQSSREIIKAFSPSQFAEGAQRAREAAKETSHRTLNLVSSILLKTLTSAV